MKREGSLWTGAAVLGIAASVGLVTNRTASPPPAAAPVKAAKSYSRAVNPAMQALADGPCPDIERLLQSFLLVDEGNTIAPASCYPEENPHPANSPDFQKRWKQVRFVIATLPDPLHTHFPLIFDRATEAVEDAAQDEHFVYDSSWLPWETEEASYGRIDDQDTAQKRKEQQEDQPGFLLFRRSIHEPVPSLHPFEGGLAVLIVGEEPTGGIHRRQFENAVQWIAALQPDAAPDAVQILGPSFSGSIPSLVELLQGQADSLEPHTQHGLRIFSGSVTSNKGVAWLQTTTAKGLGKKALAIQFRSFQHSGNVDLDRYCRYLYAAGTKATALAIVSEDETAFGAEYNSGNADLSPCRPNQKETPGQPAPQGPLYLYYPRDIAALRAAYQNQSIFSQGTAQLNGNTSRRTLQNDLADPEGKDHDTIRSYGGDQTALSQEAELQQMVSLMRAHNTQYILVRSSNPLDQLFISHFFRLTYPQGRIVLVGSDLLLRRETGASGLNGVMALSTYPLLPWEQDWTRTKQAFVDPKNIRYHSHRIFENDGVEGDYIAMRFLLHPASDSAYAITGDLSTAATANADGAESASNGFVPANCDPQLTNLPDYAAPFWMRPVREGACHHPATWISVLGNGGFWPVAALDFPTDVGKSPPPGIPDLDENRNLWGRFLHSIGSVGTSLSFFFMGHGVASDMPQAWPPMPPSMKLLLLAGLLWALFHAHCCCRASITVKPAHRAHFVKPNCTSTERQATCDIYNLIRQQNSHRALILFGSILIALLAITLAWGYGEMSEGGEPLPNPWWYRAFLPFIWTVAGLAVCGNAWMEYFRFEAKDPDDALSASLWPSRSRVVEQLKPARLRQSLGVVTEKMHSAGVWRSLLLYTLISLLLYWLLAFSLDGSLNTVNRIPTYWRAINLATGVSPLIPLLSLIAGLYGWFWFSLQGVALFGEDRPQLPDSNSLLIDRPERPGKPQRQDDLLRMLSSDGAGQPIEELCAPFSPKVFLFAGACFVGLSGAGWWLFGLPPIRNLGSEAYSLVFCLWLVFTISILLTNAWQLGYVWLRLRQILQFINKLPLRRTMATCKGFSWGSVWKIGGSVLDLRYMVIFRQMEVLTHLRESLLQWEELKKTEPVKAPVCKNAYRPDLPSACRWIDQLDATRRERTEFARWYSKHWNNPSARQMSGLKSLQQSLARTAATMLTQLLLPAWRTESGPGVWESANKADDKEADAENPPLPTLPPHIRNAEELVCLVYIAYIQNILGRLRSLVMGMIGIFLSITIAVASYPFDPRPLLSSIVVALFVTLGGTVVLVYSQMHRDATLSYLTATKPGELGMDFWIKLISFAVGPVLGLIASVFPEFTDFIFSWVQPGVASLK
jgi:hypothetical protein